MGKKRSLLAVAMAMVLMLVVGSDSKASHEGAWPPIKVDLSIQAGGKTVTAVVWVKNEGDFDSGVLNIRAQVPRGAKYVHSWAGWGPGFNAGVFDGNDVGWINAGVKAGGWKGPFVYIFDASALSPNFRASVSAWVSWAGKAPGNAISKAVRIQSLSPALDVAVGTPPASPSPVPSVPTGTDEGKTLFTNKGCAACHGANAEGGVVGRALGAERDRKSRPP